MKKTLLLILSLLLSLTLLIPSFADGEGSAPVEERYTVFSEEEKAIVYKHQGDWDNGSANVIEGTAFVIYEFKLNEGDNVATLSLPIVCQYKVEASKGDPDDASSYKVVAEKTKTQQEIETNVDFWGCNENDPPITINLSAFCKDNAAGKIYVKITEADGNGSHGPQIQKKNPIIFTHQNCTSTESKFTAGSGDAEFIYKNDGSWVDGDARNCERTQTVIYQFAVAPGANKAELALNIHNQYYIEVATKNPDDPSSYEVIDKLEIPDDADLEAEPWWGASETPVLHTYDLSKYCTDSDIIYVKIGDIAPDNGWGARIYGEVRFSSSIENVSPGTHDAFVSGVIVCIAVAAGAVVFAKKKH